MWWYGSIIGVSLAHQLECQRTEMTCLHAASMMSTTDSNGRADRALKTVQWNMCVSSERQLMAIAPAYAGTVYCILYTVCMVWPATFPAWDGFSISTPKN